MKRFVKKAARQVARKLPLSLLKVLVARNPVGVFYHMVADRPLPHTRHLYPYRPVASFEADLDYLASHYQPLGYQELVRGTGGAGVHLSFDDGFKECFTIVRPLLKKSGFPAIFFLTTDFLDNESLYYRNKVSLCIEHVLRGSVSESQEILNRINREFGTEIRSSGEFIDWVKTLTQEEVVNQVCTLTGVNVSAYLKEIQPYLTREQVKVLVEDGFTIGAHGRNHHKLARLTQDKMAEEIVGSSRIIAALTGQEIVPFSFPNSGDKVDRDFLEDLRREHPGIGLFFDTKGLKRDRNIIVNRVWIEAPRFSPEGNTALPLILKRAYQEQWIG